MPVLLLVIVLAIVARAAYRTYQEWQETGLLGRAELGLVLALLLNGFFYPLYFLISCLMIPFEIAVFAWDEYQEWNQSRKGVESNE